jgi:hypothetical protein
VNEEDYPALFRSAEGASGVTQNAYLRFILAQSILLAIGATLALYPFGSVVVSTLSAAVFFTSLGVTILARTKHFQRIWYQARALAESIKTASWRFMMASEPFTAETASSEITFQNLLRELLKENESLGDYFAGASAAARQLTDRMREVRNFPLAEKIAFYQQNRIRDQRTWYATKAMIHQKRGKFWFGILVTLYILAAVCALVRIAAPEFKFYPSGTLAVVASGVLTWIQAKKYSEIAAAYNLASHEIGIIEEQLKTINSGEEFSAFVADAESAFSREHTQWAARRHD